MNHIQWALNTNTLNSNNKNLSRLNRYQENIVKSTDWNISFRRAIVQGSKEAIVNIPHSNRHQQIIATVSASVAAPFLIDYTLWLLNRAKEENVERLYFLARDAQYLHTIAETLAPQIGNQCDLRYLQVSRIAINLAAAGGLNGESQPWLLSRIKRMTAYELGERLHLQLHELREVIHSAGLSHSLLKEQMGEQAATEILKVLQRENYQSMIAERANQSADRVIPYLCQEGVLDPLPIGVVDLGGIGSQFQAIARFRRDKGLTRPIGFLACRDQNPPLDDEVEIDDGAGCEKLHVYLSDDLRGTGPKRFAAQITLLEVFSAANHGRVSGYEKQNDNWIPVTGETYAETIERWGLETIRASMAMVLSHVVNSDLFCNVGQAPAGVATNNLRAFVLTPSREEAITWGSFPSLDDVGSELSKALNYSDLASVILRREIPISSRRWLPASLHLSPFWLRTAVSALTALRRYRKRWPALRRRLLRAR